MPRSMFRTNTLVATRPPASLHIRAGALSRGNLLLPNTLEHAARWWPNGSFGRPHLHMRSDRVRGRERRRFNKTRNRSGSMRVNGEEGHVDGAKPALGPACDLTMALSRSSILGNMVNLRSTQTAASCCQPCLGDPGSWCSAPAANADHCGTSQSSNSSNSAAALLAAARHGDCVTPSKWYTMTSAMCGCRFCTIGSVSAQLAQYADTRVRMALLKPKPPRDSGSELTSLAILEHATAGTSKILQRPRHMISTWAWANSNTISGRTTHKWKFALAEAQWRRNNHADCKSGTPRIPCNNISCCSNTFSRCFLMKSLCPTGAPNTLMPCFSVGISDPLHTLAPGFAASAILCNSSQIAGLVPAKFQMCVFPSCTLILACLQCSRSTDTYPSRTS